MERDFEGRSVVITGAGGALGRAVAERLSAAGAVCHLPIRGDRLPWPLDARGAPGARLAAGIDLTSEPAVTAFYRSLPQIWASIHCAGGFAMAPLTATSLEDAREMWSINLVTCFLCSREAVRRLGEAPAAPEGAGRIVNVAAMPAVDPRRGAGMIAYAASKAAVATLTVALDEETRPKGIRVNAVAPGILDTPANRAAMPDADFTAWTPLERAAEVIAFLASPRNVAAHGALVPV